MACILRETSNGYKQKEILHIRLKLKYKKRYKLIKGGYPPLKITQLLHRKLQKNIMNIAITKVSFLMLKCKL